MSDLTERRARFVYNAALDELWREWDSLWERLELM